MPAAPPAAIPASNEGRKESNDDAQNLARMTALAKERRWFDALDALTNQNDPKPYAELLRKETAPMVVQKRFADLLAPKFSPVPIRLKLERSRREVRKHNAWRERDNFGWEIDRRIREIEESSPSRKKTALVDSVVLELEKECGRSGSYLHKCYKEWADGLARTIEDIKRMFPGRRGLGRGTEGHVIQGHDDQHE
jgi:hypothetical protein